MYLLIRWIVNALALFIVVTLLRPHLSADTVVTLVIAAAVLGLLNAIVKPILVVLTFPITVVTLGLFLIVLNAIMLELTSWLVRGFRIASFPWAIAAAIVFGLISLVTHGIGRRDDSR